MRFIQEGVNQVGMVVTLATYYSPRGGQLRCDPPVDQQSRG